MAIYKIGKLEKEGSSKFYSDAEKAIANKGYYLEFLSISTGKTVQFKAMLTSFSDKYSSKWSSEEAYGRMDPIEIFSNTKRNIAVSLSIVAASEEEAITNMQKISLLVSMLYPTYNDSSLATSMTSAPLFRLTFANLIRNSAIRADSSESSLGGLVGRMSGLDVTPNLDAGFFDKDVGKLYPKEYSISFDYTVFHTHTVGWNQGAKQFWVPNYPYGEQHFESEDLKDTKSDSKDNKTSQQKKAAINKITKGGRK